MNEIWKVWKDTSNVNCGALWEISNLGKVRKNGELIDTTKKLIVSGYVKINSELLHRLVYTLFVGNIPKGYEIDHIDCNKQNNNVTNLRLCTSSENKRNPITTQHRIKSQQNYINSLSDEERVKRFSTTKGKKLSEQEIDNLKNGHVIGSLLRNSVKIELHNRVTNEDWLRYDKFINTLRNTLKNKP